MTELQLSTKPAMNKLVFPLDVKACLVRMNETVAHLEYQGRKFSMTYGRGYRLSPMQYSRAAVLRSFLIVSAALELASNAQELAGLVCEHTASSERMQSMVQFNQFRYARDGFKRVLGDELFATMLRKQMENLEILGHE